MAIGLMNDELERIWKESVMLYCKHEPRVYLHGGSISNHTYLNSHTASKLNELSSVPSCSIIVNALSNTVPPTNRLQTGRRATDLAQTRSLHYRPVINPELTDSLQTSVALNSGTR
jgi:hypothetical protein